MARVMARAATPPSQVDPVELCDFINGEKDLLKECDADVKDAKRRINAVKPKANRLRPRLLNIASLRGVHRSEADSPTA